MSGTVHVVLDKNLFPVRSLVLTLKVEESTKMRMPHVSKAIGNYEEDHFGNHRFFSTEFVICNLADGSPSRGQHSYPFSIKLPEWLPSSMTTALDRFKAYAAIEYTLMAQFIPIFAEDWEDEAKRISSFYCEVPIYIMLREVPLILDPS